MSVKCIIAVIVIRSLLLSVCVFVCPALLHTCNQAISIQVLFIDSNYKSLAKSCSET